MALIAPVRWTKEEEIEKLIGFLCHPEQFANHPKNGIDLLFINSMFPLLHIYDPWDLFAFCHEHGIWLDIIKFSDGYRYRGIQLTDATIITIK